MIWPPPSKSRLYYLRMILTIVKGPTCYKDIKDVSGKVLDSFRDACFEMGFLEDNNEYVAAINEAKDCGSRQLRKLFMTMLISSRINRPHHVWEITWSIPCDGILYQQINKTSNKGNCVLLYF